MIDLTVNFFCIGLPYITEDLNAPSIATTLSAALFVLFMGLAPVVWAAISEHFRIRRFLFLLAMIIFMACSLGAVFVTNIWALVAVRCIQSVGVSSGNSIGTGYIADLYPIEKRGAAFGKYVFGTIFGPLLGPIIGGFLVMSSESWRATFWFCFAFGLFILCVIFFFLPETYRDNAKFDHAQLPTGGESEKVYHKTDVDLEIINHSKINNDTSISPITKNEKIKSNSSNSDSDSQKSGCSDSTLLDDTAKSIITINDDDITDCILHHEDEKKSIHNVSTVYSEKSEKPIAVIASENTKKEIFNPFAPFALLRHPFVLMPSITAGLFFGAMFDTEAILPQAFSDTYGLNSWQTGLCYLGAGIGNLSGAFVGTRLSDRLLLRARRLRGGKPKAEDRLTANIWFAGLIFNPLGLLLFGWVVEYKLSIWGAIIGFGIQCFANVQVMTTVTAYLVDSVPVRGASATAAANSVRLTFGCILTVVSTLCLLNWVQDGPLFCLLV